MTRHSIGARPRYGRMQSGFAPAVIDDECLLEAVSLIEAMRLDIGDRGRDHHLVDAVVGQLRPGGLKKLRPDFEAPVLRQDGERLQIRQAPGRPRGEAGTDGDEGVADRPAALLGNDEERLRILEPGLVLRAAALPGIRPVARRRLGAQRGQNRPMMLLKRVPERLQCIELVRAAAVAERHLWFVYRHWRRRGSIYGSKIPVVRP